MTDHHLQLLEASARHATDRYRLYRARVSGPHATSLARLRELEREAERAQRTLAQARTAEADPSPTR